MPYEARIEKFGREYYSYDPDRPNEPDGPNTRVLPVIMNSDPFSVQQNSGDSNGY